MKILKPTSILTASTLLMLLTIAALLSGCGSGGQKTTSPEAVRIITEASQKKDYIRVVLLADSQENAHVMSEGESYYWQGHAYYRLLQRRAAEFYWKESMKATENQTDTASLGTYAKSASYLTSLYIRYLDFPNALKVVKPARDHLNSREFTASSDYTNLLIFEGCCHAHFNAQDSVVNPIFERAYDLHISNIKKNPTKEAYRSAVAGIINIAYGWLSEKRYEQGLMWTERLGNLIEEYKQLFDNNESYIEKQWARYKIFSAIGMEGIGKLDQAAEAFVEYQKTRFAYTIEGQLDASNYLAMSGRWKEAADQLLNLDEFFDSEQTGTSLEDIQICRLNLKLNVLEYCNAGHNPPVIGNADGQFSFLEMKPNSPIGLWPGLDYVGESIDDFSNQLLLLYTDGLNEAENTVQEQFGDEQIVKLLSAMSSSKAQDIIENLKSEVERFRNGAEPNDDLTMMCVRYSPVQPV